MIDKEHFLSKYKIADADFEASGLNWDNLIKIYNDYLEFKDQLETSANLFTASLMKVSKVHSVRYRVKDPEHLIEKIIRKRILDEKSDINIDNYKSLIRDLLGLRALHLYKEDWESLNEYIHKNFEVIGKPIAKYRKGDQTDFFLKHGCDIEEHKFGYRSVHYIIETKPGKTVYFGEIQVRTIFEEAWAEIDHTVRYPYDQNNILYSQFLLILNRLAGSADEMGSYILLLKKELEARKLDYDKEVFEKTKLLEDFEKKINELNVEREVSQALKKDLEKLRSQPFSSSIFDPGFSKRLQDAIGNLPNYSSLITINDTISNLRFVSPQSIIPRLVTLEEPRVIRVKKSGDQPANDDGPKKNAKE